MSSTEVKQMDELKAECEQLCTDVPLIAQLIVNEYFPLKNVFPTVIIQNTLGCSESPRCLQYSNKYNSNCGF